VGRLKEIMMANRTLTSLAVMGALGILAPIQANAFGLGSIELSSALNEPFLAEIPVTALKADEVGNLHVQLASREEFERAGLIHNFLLTNLKFEIVEVAGKTKVVITSTQPVKEPFIDFLLTATTGNGRLIREYTVLLDPPKNVFTRPVSTSAPASQIESKPSTPSTSQPKTTSYQYDSPTSYTTSVTSYGITDRNDTLWDVALETRPEKSISVHQMMMALLKENSRAFSHNNINGLKAGYTLSVPSSDVIKQISKKQAISAVSEQNTSWKNRNVSIAPIDTVVTEEQSDEISSEMDSSDIQEQDLESVSTEATSEKEDSARLQLVAPNNETAMVGSELSPMGSSELEAINEQLTLAQETIEGQTQENIDLQARMSVMEEQIQTLHRLISLKDADMARLQSSLEQEEVLVEEVVEPTEEQIEQQAEVDAYFEQVEDDVSEVMLSGDDEILSDDEQDQLVSDIEVQDDMQLQQDSSEAAEPAYELTGVPEIDEVINDVDETIDDVMENVDLSFIPSVDEVVSYTSEVTGVDENEMKSALEKVKTFLAQYKMESLAVGLLFLIVIWLLIRRRNRPDISWDEAVGKLDETAVVTPDDADQEQELEVSEEIVEISNEIEQQAEQITEEIEKQVESEPTPTKTVDDLIQDADVYVSYGDFEKAKLTLQEAISDEPSNDVVNHKLLFVLFKQQQQNEFIDLASQGQIDKESFEWAEVVEWGRELAPEHQLFKQEEVEQEIESDELVGFEAPVLDSDYTEPEDTLSDVEVDSDDHIVSVEQDSSDDNHDDLLDFTTEGLSSDEQQEEESVETASQTEEETTFDTPLEFNIETDTELTPDDASLDLDITLDDDAPTIEFDGLAEITEADMSEVTEALSTENELEFNLGEFDNIDEAETKLDLAAAYIDMGDSAGASSILEEVIKEGNEEQKARAETMLKDLS
jgi:pilus assembly protein FimV